MRKIANVKQENGYGVQQYKDLLHELKSDPYSRYLQQAIEQVAKQLGYTKAKYQQDIQKIIRGARKNPKQNPPSNRRKWFAEVKKHLSTVLAREDIPFAFEMLGRHAEILTKREYESLKKFIESHMKPKKRNATESLFNEDKIDSFSAMFQGKINGKELETVGSDLTPPITARLGRLSLMKIRNGHDKYDVTFKGDAYLAADARSNLYILGRNGRINNIHLPKEGSLAFVGKLDQINYVTDKAHIENGKMVEYYHALGEVDGVKPDVYIDHNGFPIITGGNYVIGTHGIEN